MYEDATRWSEEEARAKFDMERHTMLMLASSGMRGVRHKHQARHPNRTSRRTRSRPSRGPKKP